jgi:hypothetical protein
MTITKEGLSGFTGTSTYYPHWTGRLVYTDGVQYLAEEGKAYWLLDAIASYQADPRIKNNPMLSNIQFWKLEVRDNKGVLTCIEDLGRKPVIVQNIEYTDFPLDEIEVWVERGCFPSSEEDLVEAMVAYLPSER